ncbi:transcriptional regulator, AraC family [Rathayibacter oskolensis]|uniref:Transcriptional regulator, AraC family n=1 Tax=Rathayibacter oskolensis TaxID=1891671 RepID=A0A1X7PHS0_9MICO|nr:AraC family transcriptional regulator [Rathayibacter oskolensis]SMH51095.1 transcriptional regulator, AraC family [Rathayibacter oskolensis]
MTAPLTGSPPGWQNVHVREVVDPHEREVSSPPLDALQLILVTSGSYVIESARPHGRWQKGQAAPGRSAATPPGREIRASWSSRSTETFTSLHVAVDAPLLAGVFDAFPGASAGQLDFLALSDGFVRSGMLEIARAARAGAPALLADTVSVSLVSHLLSLPAPAVSRAETGLSRAQLALVTDHLAAHLAETVTLAELAELVHLSSYHFLRLFSAATGTSPMRHLTALRMEHGRDLLRRGDAPIGVVAAACGYGTPAAFAAAYRRHHGVSPREHRSQRD